MGVFVMLFILTALVLPGMRLTRVEKISSGLSYGQAARHLQAS